MIKENNMYMFIDLICVLIINICLRQVSFVVEKHGSAHEMLVFLSYAQNPHLNTHAGVSRGLGLGVILASLF